MGHKGADFNGNGPAAASAAMDGITLNLLNVKGGDVVYFNNNAKYAGFVEFGTSSLKPRAMVRKAINKANTIARNALRKINV